MSDSIRFDRAVEYSDRTRGLSEEGSRRQTELLAGELAGRGRCLEIGVGTGLVAIPLAAAGVPLVGLDLSAPMLARLVRNAGGVRPFPLVIGDATSLPLGTDAVGAAIVRHVFHLIPGWRGAVDELVRVVRPGGTVLVSAGDIPPPWREVTRRFVEVTARGALMPGLDLGRDLPRLDEAFRDLGGAPRRLPSIPERVDTSLGTFIEQMGDGMHSWTWDVPEEQRREVAAEIRTWAEGRFGSLDPPEARTVVIAWRAYDLA
ncbi:MAG TPA: class I SAM-dependent methyltransferase [Actinomycetota bacterium]|nr:class I SAM-dependent methyltransferase [Actinomycetota bacterium]